MKISRLPFALLNCPLLCSTAFCFAQLPCALLNCTALYRLDVLSDPAFFFPLAKTAKLSSVAHALLLFGVPCRGSAEFRSEPRLRAERDFSSEQWLRAERDFSSEPRLRAERDFRSATFLSRAARVRVRVCFSLRAALPYPALLVACIFGFARYPPKSFKILQNAS
jgi:hypothetical protein